MRGEGGEGIKMQSQYFFENNMSRTGEPVIKYSKRAPFNDINSRNRAHHCLHIVERSTFVENGPAKHSKKKKPMQTDKYLATGQPVIKYSVLLNKHHLTIPTAGKETLREKVVKLSVTVCTSLKGV